MTYYKMFVTCWLDNGKLRKPQECFHTRNLLPDLLAFLINPWFSMYRDLHSRRCFQIFRECHAFEKKLLLIPRSSVTWRNSASQHRWSWFLLIGTVWFRWTRVFLLQATGISLGFRPYSGYSWSDNWFPCFDLICSLKCLFSQRSIN